MRALYDNVDSNGLREYSVVYTDRSLNHMSKSFQSVMTDISAMLKEVYNAHRAVIVPGSGTFGMEAVARQFARDKKCLVIRNGWFSYRWSQIFEMGNLPSETLVLKARREKSGSTEPFSPVPIEEAVDTIKREKPALVFAPHVETSAGMILPDDYISALADAVHSVGGLMVLDCIASGTIWVDMQKTGVDLLISAPQKGWSGPPCAGLVMMSEQARESIEQTTSDSFSADLKKWLQIMETYESGAHAYHATMPTESLRVFRDVMLGQSFAAKGAQIAAGVPLMCDEGDDYSTFRLGLFGLDKLQNVDRTVDALQTVLNEVIVTSSTEATAG